MGSQTAEAFDTRLAVRSNPIWKLFRNDQKTALIIVTFA